MGGVWSPVPPPLDLSFVSHPQTPLSSHSYWSLTVFVCWWLFFTQHHMILKLLFPLTLMLHYLHRGCGCLLLSPPPFLPPSFPRWCCQPILTLLFVGNFFLLHSFTSSNSPEDSSKTSFDQKGKSQETKESSSGQLWGKCFYSIYKNV